MTIASIAALTLALSVPLQDAPASVQNTETTDAARAQAEKEAAFADLLSGSTLAGYTTLTDGDGKLQSEELAKDSYDLAKVSKQKDGKWRFTAKINYGGTPIPVSVSLPVEWAGDTPVVSVTDMKVPLMGTYSARVVFHGDQYVGVWSGDGYGGHIFGRVVKTAQGIAPAAGGMDQQAAANQNWTSFRGNTASGVAEGHATVASFDVEKGENVRWKTPIDGLAHSSPVIWGDKLFITTAVRVGAESELQVGLYGNIASVEDEGIHRFEVHCYDKNTGELIWKKVPYTGLPYYKRHTKGSFAASSPACDANCVVAFFGSEGIYAFDHDGEPLWQHDFGRLDSSFFMMPEAQWGFSSSPVLHDGRVIVQIDVMEDSFVAAMDATNGEFVWRTERSKEEPGWATPTVHVGENGTQVICNGWKETGAYDFATGSPLWTAAPGGDIPVPTPIIAHGHVYLTSSHGSLLRPIMAIDLNATGHVSFDDGEDEFMTWGVERRGNYMQTPIVVGNEAYFCKDNGVLTCYDATTGEEHYSERLDEGRSGYTSSPVAADGKVYFTSEEGTVVTVQAGKEFKILSRSDVGEVVMSTPAISTGVIFIRARNHLYAIGS